ncbi:hypothetical protein A2662_01640 [Candidatus Giovannonibacteria bacterium RIFCSPHIGHO2_01_FULL_45_33]|nr:MAG: hypothetical protein A2662_01640 [Candidatus Giovannonibacteria bacterium RIFCSPHIGHO2_01_FULL_45_33]
METILTAYEMFERSARFYKDMPAIIFESTPTNGGFPVVSKNWTYRDLLRHINIFAHALASSGVMHGDKVCLSLPNSPNLIAAYFALSKLGAVSIMLNPALPEEQKNNIAKETGSVILIDEDTAKNMCTGKLSARTDFPPDNNPLCPEDASAVLFSSGTTGEQKGVELTVKNIFHNVKYTSVLTGMTPADKIICFIPLTHCFGLNFVMTACFYTGATLVLHEKFDPNQVLNSLAENQVSMFFSSPPAYNLFLEKETDPFYFSSVRYFFYAAAPLSVEAALKWKEHYGKIIYTGWGLTETTPCATSNHPSIHRLGSIGKAIPGVEVKVLDENGKRLKMPVSWYKSDLRFYQGEICVRGANVMKGYLNNPAETAKAIDNDGWFHTGDIGYEDPDGYFFLTDRSKDMINNGGEKVWPAEVEKKIMRHPAVLEAAVIGIPHKIMGEVPKAFIVLKEEVSATAQELQEFLKPLLTKNQFPREIEFLEKLPRNPSGKVLKKELRKK